MNAKELKYILQEGESYLVEFKERVNKSLARELTAFANASGGRIFLGVNNQGNVKGIKNTNTLRSQIQDIAFNCQPSITVHITSFQNVVIVSVPEGKDKPYQCSDGFFIRMGANSQKMGRDQLVDFLQAEGILRFEEQYHSRFDFAKHYNPERLNAFLRLAGISKELDDEPILENLGVADRLNKKLAMKNAGVLFFAKSIELLCEQATITCGTFEGTDRFQVVNRKDYQEDLITNINLAIHFIRQELRVRYEMTGTPRRKEVYEIPLDAIREAIVNAVSHRDYLQTGSHTTVEIFDDRMEISNPGGLPKGLTEKEFGKKAVRRNQIIASLLQRVDLVENMGTGIHKIQRLLKDAGCPEPEFEFDSFFTIIFKRDTSGIFDSPEEDRSRKSSVKSSVKTADKIIELMRENSLITIPELAKTLGITTRAIEKQIAKLQKNGQLKRIGPAKGGRWEIVDG